jgi:hypothetical protein
MQRLMRSLQGAQERYLATPEAERVYTVEEALKLLAEYVVLQIRDGGHSESIALVKPLPSILEPYIALSPVLEAIWRNALATYALHHGDGHEARSQWLKVLEKLEAVSGAELAHVHAIYNAVAFAVGMVEAQLGLSSATSWADRLDADPYQRVSALQLRRIVRLEQGDLKGAERFRRQAEVLALQMRSPQMFKKLLNLELAACAKLGDLAGIQDSLERVRPMAASYPGWVPHLLYGETCFELARGDFQAAKLKAEATIAAGGAEVEGCATSLPMWLAGQIALAETLLRMKRPSEARAVALHALERHTAERMSDRNAELAQVLALSEAALGEPAAAGRLEAAIAAQRQLGVTGVQLGMSYEARAHIAILQNDAASFERYAELAATEYRYGAQSGLGARYERLINEARRRGLRTSDPRLMEGLPLSNTEADSTLASQISLRMSTESEPHERALLALRMICEARQVEGGHLFLSSADGAVALGASQGSHSPMPTLDQLRSFLTEVRKREADMDDMETGWLSSDPRPDTKLEVDGVQLELLVLSCVVDGDSQIVGLATIAANDNTEPASPDSELLSTLAKHLLQA